MVTYGVGTALEATITLIGNTPLLNTSWYIAGAILGGYPLAQGSVYLHLARRTAHWLTAFSLLFVIGASIAVALSPVDTSLLQAHRPGGAAFSWQWVRLLTPIINLYAVIFLIGSAIYSAIRFAQRGDAPDRAIGNALIAFGAILPGIGGSFAKGGLVEALYVGEFLGILFIWWGYQRCLRKTEARITLEAPDALAARR